LKIKGVRTRPIIINIIPPANSLYHARIRITSKIKDGIRCIKKAPSCCHMVRPGSNASAANILMNNMARMHIILGSQWNMVFEFFILKEFKKQYIIY
jgi:hypothetical protein